MKTLLSILFLSFLVSCRTRFDKDNELTTGKEGTQSWYKCLKDPQQESELRSISPEEYLSLLKNRFIEVMNRDTYSYKSPKGELAKNGPWSTWKYEMLITLAKEVRVEPFVQVNSDGETITWDDYTSLQESLCQAKKIIKVKGRCVSWS